MLLHQYVVHCIRIFTRIYYDNKQTANLFLSLSLSSPLKHKLNRLYQLLVKAVNDPGIFRHGLSVLTNKVCQHLLFNSVDAQSNLECKELMLDIVFLYNSML